MNIRTSIPVLLAVCLLIPCLADAADCEKARQVYASGVNLLSYEDRAKTFQQAIALCPTYAEAHVNLADAYEKLAVMSKNDPKRFNALLDNAASEYLSAIKLNKNLFAAHLGLGDTYRVMGLYERSEKAYQDALRLKPDHPKAISGIDKIKLIKSQEKAGLKTAAQIVQHAKLSDRPGLRNLMGFEGHTAIKDRLSFNNFLFDEWSAQLNRPETQQQLDEIGKALGSREFANCNFVIEGHTDNRGDENRNMQLSLDRADSVRIELINRYGISEDRIKTQGFGLTRPRVPNDSPENFLKNRRVEILFVERSQQ